MLITLSGLDGAGKSTLAEALRASLEKDGTPAVVFHMNKQIGLYAYARSVRDALKRAVGLKTEPPATPETPPAAASDAPRRAGKTKAFLLELRRRIIWSKALRRWVDLGDLATFLIYRLYVEKVRGRVLIMDRYFYDRMADLADGRRWRYLRWFSRLAPVPHVPVFIEVSPEEAFARKGEYSIASMTARRGYYDRIFSWVPGSITVSNDDAAVALAKLQGVVRERMATKRVNGSGEKPAISRMQLKRAVKGSAGFAAVAASRFVRPPDAGTGCILAWHRVADLRFVDPDVDDWNVAPNLFERQLLAIMDCAEIVPLTDIRGRCQGSAPGARPVVSLTFDDGYANFCTQVLPVLKRYNVPATVFVVTSLIGSDDPPPFDGWSTKHRERADPDAWRPMDWAELEKCAQSGLVAIGGHSHRHLKARDCSAELLVEEAERSMEILRSRFDDVAAYAYPYGSSRLGYVPPSYVSAVAAAGYRLGVTTDVGRITADTDAFLMPRIEANGVDGPAVIRAKVLGSLAPYYVTDRLRRAERAA